jgi:putative Mg2+ transporter-C (MgtC) family protein
MHEHLIDISIRLVLALVIGGIIGLERSYHGRPAGFRTHALVCVASSLLMLVTAYESLWFSGGKLERVVVDPTRMAQGIMTGLSVRGLTTAASIWITAAIGILTGIGFYFPAVLATVLTLGTLSMFRWIEARMPSQFHAHHTVRFACDAAIAETEYRKIIAAHGFTIANLSYRVDKEKNHLEYRMMIRTRDHNNAKRLTDTLTALDAVTEFRMSPTGD